MKKILIVGATSAMAIECARIWAAEQAELFLVGRNKIKLKQVADDLSVLGACKTHIFNMDLNEINSLPTMVDACYSELEKVDILLVAHGTLPDQKACEEDYELALREYSTNCLSVISVLALIANKMEKAQHGTIAVISSVAGDRGRSSNYLYGSAKAAVTTFCEGLRVRLFKSGVHVLTIKPGFVRTPMTEGMPLPEMLVSSPKKIARIILKGIEKKRDSIYAPFFWSWIMLIIKNIPNAIFKRMSL